MRRGSGTERIVDDQGGGGDIGAGEQRECWCCFVIVWSGCAHAGVESKV